MDSNGWKDWREKEVEEDIRTVAPSWDQIPFVNLYMETAAPRSHGRKIYPPPPPFQNSWIKDIGKQVLVLDEKRGMITPTVSLCFVQTNFLYNKLYNTLSFHNTIHYMII